MTILLMPTLACNFRCAHCFEGPANPELPNIPLNIEAMETTLAKLWEDPYYQGSGIGVHGGECLTVSPPVLEKMFQLQQKYEKQTSIVTNCSLINPSFIQLFKKYKTHVAVSVDGPPELNLLRGPKPFDEKVTAGYNKLLNKNIRLLRSENIGVSVMCIINKINSGSPKKVARMIEWFDELAAIGITGGRINPMYTDGSIKKYELNNDELLYAYKKYAQMTFANKTLRWLPFREMVDNILGFSTTPCIFCDCDYLCTHTVTIYPDGSVGNCDRTFAGNCGERSVTGKRGGRGSALSQTQCDGCKYWKACHGGCPCEGLNGDWRNKTRFCEAIYGTYQFIEDYLTGLMPNIRLDSNEPFAPLTWAAVTERPSTFANYELRKQNPNAAAPVVQRNTSRNGAHGDEHGNTPHGDHYDGPKE